MNTKTVLIILSLGVLVLLGVSIFLLSNNRSQKQSSRENKTEALQSMNASVAYNGKTFTPDSLSLKKGSSLTVGNSSDKKINIAIQSDKANIILNIQAGKTVSTPIQIDGTYTFKEVNDSSQSAKNLTPVPTKEIKSTPVVIDEKGFTPNKVTINTDTKISFDNKSGKDFYFLRTSDMPSMPNVFLSDTKSTIEFKEGKYRLVNKNNTNQILEIVVNK